MRINDETSMYKFISIGKSRVSLSATFYISNGTMNNLNFSI